MYERNLRYQYFQDMAALKIQLYQLSRLVWGLFLPLQPTHAARIFNFYLEFFYFIIFIFIQILMWLQLHDLLPDVHAHLEEHGVDPFLYATPWFLTVFSSTFSLRFSSRILGELRR